MDRRWNFLLFVPLLIALFVFVVTQQLIYTAISFVVGYVLVEGLRFLVLPPHLHRAVKRFQEGDMEGALALAERSIDAKPDRWESHYLYALINFALGNLERAANSAEEAAKLAPKNDSSHLLLGRILADQRQFEAAREVLSTAVDLRPKEGMNRYHLGAVLFRLGDCQVAVPQLGLALALGLEEAQPKLLAHYYLAHCHERQDRPEEAAVHLRELRERQEAVAALRDELRQAPSYPSRDLLLQDVAAIESLLQRPAQD